MESITRSNHQNDKSAITYKDMFLGSVGVVYFRRIKITEKAGEHASLYVEAVLDSDTNENDFHEIKDTVSLMYRKEGKEHVLFYGVVDKVFMNKDGGEWLIRLEARDGTCQMDVERRKRIFQNPQMSVRQLISKVMDSYSGSDHMVHLPDEPVGQLLVQYEETDWEFLRRFFIKIQGKPLSGSGLS
uniref:contractile injection system protein, VgrG/Pvc8 family n=1 Tax=Clostridium sp. NkU-1 TaxID=1095009 RepID=UPI0006D1F578